MSKNKKSGAVVRKITTAAMLAAISAVIGIICKNLFTFNGYYRFTLENAPVILSGLLFGPVVGAAVGVCADAVSCLMSTNPALNPIISVGAATVGALSGLAPCIIKMKGVLQTTFAAGLAHLVGQVTIKSVAKMIYFDMPWYGIFIGLGFSAVAAVIEVKFILWLRSLKGLENHLGGGK